MILNAIKSIKSKKIKKLLLDTREKIYRTQDIFTPKLTSKKYLNFDLYYTRGCGIVDRLRFLSPDTYYERDFTETIFKYIKSDNPVIVDVGANIGLISLNILEKFPKATIFAFEPGVIQRACLEISIVMNQIYDRVVVRNTALSDTKGVAKFYTFGNVHNSGDGLKNTLRNQISAKIVDVTVDTLDNEVENLQIKRIDIIKIDVEGNELNVINGAKTILEKFKPIIFLEISPKNLAAYNLTPEDVRRGLNAVNYNLYTLGSELINNEKELMDALEYEDMFIGKYIV